MATLSIILGQCFVNSKMKSYKKSYVVFGARQSYLLEPYIVLFILLSSIGIFIVAWWKIAGSFINVGNT